MIYNGKILDNNIRSNNKIISILNIKKYMFYCLLVFLLSRINILFYMAPVGIAFFMVCILKNNKPLSLMVGISSILGYLTMRDTFAMYNLYVIINLLLIFLSLFDIEKNRKIIVLVLIGSVIFFYKYFVVRFSISSSLFSLFTEVSIVFALHFIFSKFVKVMDLFNNNQIFTREEIICSIVTICLVITGLNGLKIFGLDLVNIFLGVFVFCISYINGVAIGVISAVFSGSIVGIIYGDFAQYIAVYSIISCISSLLYLSSRFTITLFSSVCIFMLKLSTISFNSFDKNVFFIEIFLSMVVFLIMPRTILNKFLVYFNEEYKREFYVQKRLFNTLDMRIQKINDFNDLIKQLSDMMVSNVNFRYKMLDKKIYIEILAENVCRGCVKVNSCWKKNFKIVSDELLLSLENFIQGDKNLTDYVSNICIHKESVDNELLKISNFYNMQKVYEEKIHETQDILSYELNNIHNVINRGIKEVKKDITVKVDYEKSIINNLNKFKIKYFDLLCYDDNGRVKLKIILPNKIYEEYKLDILGIINMALPRGIVFQEGISKYINSNDEMVIDYVERYNYKIISHCLQISKNEKNGDNYMIVPNNSDNHMIILSDGLGSGEEAYDKSKFTVDLIYKFIHTSLSLYSCIKEIISLISLKFFKDEAISTIDFSSIDLYTGKMNYLKFSSVITYVKRGSEVFVLESEKNIFEDEDNSSVLTGEFDLEYGDIIVHLTDGLIYFKDLSSKAWLYNFLKKSDAISPDRLCEDIIREFKFLNNGSSQDDVTVIVSKVYKNFG